MKKKKTGMKVGELLLTAGLFIPPWNIFWWSVGLYHYILTIKNMRPEDREYLSRQKNGEVLDDFGLPDPIFLLKYAPIIYPVDIFGHFVNGPLDRRKREKKEKAVCEAQKRILEELTSKGIEAIPLDEGSDFVSVSAQLASEQLGDYRDVYARALAEFSHILTPSDICKFALPIEPLNKEWAQKCGSSEYASQPVCPLCVDCGKIEAGYFWWNDEEGHREIQKMTTESRRKTQIRTVNGMITMDGYVCGECIEKYNPVRDYTVVSPRKMPKTQ